MARFTLCFILLAAALGYATPPPATPDSSVVSPNLAGVNSPVATVSGQAVLTGQLNDLANAGTGEGICYKIRAYIFKRDDDHAPRFVRSATCGPRQPQAKDAVWPKARIVPAN
jgi:hypothetical protein